MGTIAITIGSADNGNILARADKQVEASISLMDFVKIGNTIGRITRITDSHDYSTEQILTNIAKKCLKTRLNIPEETKEMLFKRIEIEPLGTVYDTGELTEFEGNIGYFMPVFEANESEIAKLYPNHKEGITIGNIASGYKSTNIPFKLDIDLALSRHALVLGKTGTGKTNFLKELIASNLELKSPLPMLIFGHPDLGMDNPNDKGTRGLSALGDDKVVLFGYEKRLKLSPEELALTDIFEQFPDMSTSMRDLWMHMQTREPKNYIEILAKYNLNSDPYKLHRQQIPDPQHKGKNITVGIAPMATIDAVSKQARVLANYIDSKASPIVSQILMSLKQSKTVLINTFNMTEYYQGLFVKLLLNRLQQSGKYAMHRKVSQKYLVVVDEAQHFIKTCGEKIAEFVMECRKFGVTLLLSTQSPASIPASVYGQIYSTIAFHLNKSDLKVLIDYSPLLEDCKSMILRPPLNKTLGLAIAQVVDYPYPAVIRVPHFERRFNK
ncbi:MAG: DUF87 domain-containing protein [bacterium]